MDGQIHENFMSYSLAQDRCNWVEALDMDVYGLFDGEMHLISVSKRYEESKDSKNATSKSHTQVAHTLRTSSISKNSDKANLLSVDEEYSIKKAGRYITINRTKPITKEYNIVEENLLLTVESAQRVLDLLQKGDTTATYKLMITGASYRKKNILFTKIGSDDFSIPSNVDLYFSEERLSNFVAGKWVPDDAVSIRIFDSHGIMIYQEYESSFADKFEIVLEDIEFIPPSSCATD